MAEEAVRAPARTGEGFENGQPLRMRASGRPSSIRTYAQWYGRHVMSREALSRLDPESLERLYGQVLLFARSRVGSPVRARELTQEAFTRAMTTRPWNADDKKSLFEHLSSIVDSLRSHEHVSRRPAYEREAGKAMALVAGTVAPSTETLVVAMEREVEREDRRVRCLGRLRTLLAAYPLELLLLDCLQEGVMDPELQAERTRSTREEVYRARERIRRFALRARAETPDEGHNGDKDGS
jgi:DNA-directed RNA polymerase specialized sigma24 family protein